MLNHWSESLPSNRSWFQLIKAWLILDAWNDRESNPVHWVNMLLTNSLCVKLCQCINYITVNLFFNENWILGDKQSYRVVYRTPCKARLIIKSLILDAVVIDG